MPFDPRRAEENLQAELAKIRSTARMRFGIVAGVIIVGLLKTNFSLDADADLIAQVVAIVRAAMPVIGLAAVATLLILALAQRDVKRARAKHESQIFRVPVRKSRP